MEKDTQIKIKTLHGKEIIPYIHQVAKLRIAIFRNYPYLYEGTLSYEERYLRFYSQTEGSILVIAEDHDQIAGAVTGLPLVESMEEIRQVFMDKGILCEQIFYLGEILLLPEYRNQKIGYGMYREFEQAVKNKGVFKELALCEILREENDIKKPIGYKSLDNFWQRQHFVKQRDMVAYFSWREIGALEETKHPMVFWIKRGLNNV